MKYATALIATTCLLLSATAAAQPAPTVEPEGAGFFAIGGAWPDTEELDTALDAAGYPTFGGGALTLGGGGYGIHRGRILVGGEGYGVIAGEDAFDGRTVTFGGGYGLFNIGYLLTPTPATRVYPLLGIGGGGSTLRIGAQATADSFGGILANPGRSSQVTRGSFLLSFGLGAEYRLHPDGHGLMVGVRAGVLVAPFTSAWHLEDSAIEGGPDASLAGPFVVFTIGGAGRQ